VRQHVFVHTTRSAGGDDTWQDLYGKDKAFADAMGFRHDHGDATVHGEDIGDVRTGAGELTRCVQAAYAVTTFFCGADRARLSPYLGLHFEGVAAISQLLAHARARRTRSSAARRRSSCSTSRWTTRRIRASATPLRCTCCPTGA
jgi:hypothetical protein